VLQILDSWLLGIFVAHDLVARQKMLITRAESLDYVLNVENQRLLEEVILFVQL